MINLKVSIAMSMLGVDQGTPKLVENELLASQWILGIEFKIKEIRRCNIISHLDAVE